MGALPVSAQHSEMSTFPYLHLTEICDLVASGLNHQAGVNPEDPMASEAGYYFKIVPVTKFFHLPRGASRPQVLLILKVPVPRG